MQICKSQMIGTLIYDFINISKNMKCNDQLKVGPDCIILMHPDEEIEINVASFCIPSIKF